MFSVALFPKTIEMIASLLPDLIYLISNLHYEVHVQASLPALFDIFCTDVFQRAFLLDSRQKSVTEMVLLFINE